MNRDQQRRRIDRVRRGIISSGIAGSLAVAGYLGFSTQTATATTSTDDTGTTTTSTSSSDSDSDSDGYAAQYGDNSTQLSPGSGAAQATTSGS